MRKLLSNGTYRWLFVAQVIALIGSGLATVALGLLAYDLGGARAGAVLGTALTIKMVAYVCVSPLVGAVLDRVPRGVVMVGADLVRCGVVLLLPWVDAIWQVYLLIAVLQAASATFTPTFQSVLPDVVPDEGDYTKALAASQFAVSLENIASPVIAAALLLVLTFTDLFVGTAVGFFVSALFVTAATVPRARRSSRIRFSERFFAGLRVFAATPRLRAVLALNVVVAGSGAITLVSTVNVVRDLLDATEAQVPLLLAVSGLGSIAAAIGAPLLLRRRQDRGTLFTGTVTAWLALAGALLLPTAPSWPLAIGVWLLIGFAGGLIVVTVNRVLRASSAVADRPALFAAQFSLSHLCWLVTYPLAGWVGAWAGLTTAWALLASLVLVAGLSALRLWPAGLPEVFRHRHDGAADRAHLADAEWDGAAWVHTHRVTIDVNHARWPQPA
ncbi:MFS transporter [Salinispora tropica]|uniref:Major facilitator superfamily MFS_1 n=1 Tax=Salinispora tropica (strain ATCC BAA-916 / DSM 44818 / JCM 13857 / NBRC 105044 / CNB-440) TaxID=369723 RepID=A4X949_SALTO|nr:MFS transporter [Salinispora tropica]ABP55406.1 major facilitator superfamily MFS_1 [Salinispora tropica CNB-440]